MLWVAPSEKDTAAALEKWIKVGKDYALTLPLKAGKSKAKKTKTLKEYKA